MSRRKDSEYLSPAPGIESQAYQYPFDNDFEIFTLRKDLQPKAPPGQFYSWGSRKNNSNPGGVTGFYTTDTKFFSLLFNPLAVVETGCACIIELNYTLDQGWPLAFGFTPIARKRQFSLIMQNHNISVIADLYVPEKFADLNLVGIPDGYAAFATRGHSKDIEDAHKHETPPLLEIRYQRALSIARKGRFCFNADAKQRLEENPAFPNPLLTKLEPLFDKEYQTRDGFSEAIFELIHAISPAIQDRDYERIFSACESGQLKVFLVYGGGEKVRQWVIDKNKRLDVPHVWWYPDAMDVVRVNRKKDIISPISR